MKFGLKFAPTRSKKFSKVGEKYLTIGKVTFLFLLSVTQCDASITLNYQPNNHESYNNATLSFFFTADPQFGWGTYYSGNEERSL